ncbi:hypothetical protein AMPH_13388 [Acinetobacter baumannii]|nr:hypothetical protein AMPH_13388 [Acinetobacter baumannii]CVI13160.1 hypothetical protein AMPH_43645 [Acinetobacter baumannii]SST30546.1 Uncharacterised protein [Acinetobacter baumannii]
MQLSVELVENTEHCLFSKTGLTSNSLLKQN